VDEEVQEIAKAAETNQRIYDVLDAFYLNDEKDDHVCEPFYREDNKGQQF